MPAPMLLLSAIMVAAGLLCARIGVRMLLADRRLEARIGFPSTPAAPRDRPEIAARLALTGFQNQSVPGWFARFRMAATLGTALVILLLCRMVWGDFLARPLLLVIGCGLAYVASRQLLHILATRRARAITAEFPFLLDLMLMMLESGISLDQCFRSIARDEGAAVPHHARMITLLVADLDRGMRYELALDRWAARVAVSGAKELAALFRQALFQGVELAPALREFIREFTQRRVTRAREAMGGITVRMVVLMILFFMPALFVVLGGPPVVAIFDSLRRTVQ